MWKKIAAGLHHCTAFATLLQVIHHRCSTEHVPTVAGVTTLALGLQQPSGAVSGVNRLGLTDDEAVLHELADVLSCAGKIEEYAQCQMRNQFTPLDPTCTQCMRRQSVWDYGLCGLGEGSRHSTCARRWILCDGAQVPHNNAERALNGCFVVTR